MSPQLDIEVGTGIEGAQNKRLAGKNGSLKTVTDVNDIPLSLGDENVKVPAEDGESLVLTLDENVQRESEKALKDIYDEYKGAIRHASIVVMNPQNGQIYSMANYPTFNPEEYYKVMDASLFTNTPTDSPYEPASICKTFTYATAVDQGKIRPDDTYVNTGKYNHIMMAMDTTLDKNGCTYKVPQGTPEENAKLDASYEHLCKMRDELVTLNIVPPISEWNKINPNL